MIKKLFIVLFLFFITGCSLINTELTKVEPPSLTKTIMNGKWNISKVIFKDETSDNNFNYKDLIGKDVYFNVDSMLLSNNYIKSPTYKAKKVIASKFIYDKYNMSKRKLGIDEEYIYIIDVYKKDDLFYEILKVDDETAYIYENGAFLQIRKLGDMIDDEDYKKLIETIDLKKSYFTKYSNTNDQSENGFLLGIKFKDENGNYKYSTIFMSFLDKKVKEYKYLDNIIIPRQNGFYLLTSNRFELEGLVGDKFEFKSLNKEQEEIYEIGSNNPTKKEIRFVSGDYINYLEGEEKQTFKLYYLSSLDNRNKLSLSDLIMNGEDVFEESVIDLKNKSMANIDESNIGLIRDKGYWKLVGRINYLKKGEKDQEFNLNVLLPKAFVKYDNLKIPFSNIKEKLSWINDAFISPNGRFLITIENEYIKVYNINGNKINISPILEEKIPRNSITIMTQWSIGRFVSIWEDKIK